ncbi:Ima1 N-terminal domain-containing protein [Chlamydoabsidia padenii]|nr:Ima1 N-terminal domain-containing protein [Chlamydoabsidia padenii]
MSSHLTKQPPSWRNWVLSKLGLTDLPTPVNCWYCNQTMYLLPGSKQTEQHWYCNLCENTNVIDECGDIMDAPPLPDTAKSSYVLSLEQRKKNQQTLSTFSRSASRRTLCDDCQHNQTLIYQFMSDYILDESSLHEKHPLCKDCQAKIQNIVAEQLATVSRRKINEQRQRSLQSITPTRLTSNQHICYGLVWLFLHCSFMIICAFAIFHPFQSSGHETVVASLQKWLWYASDYIMSLFAKNSERHTTILSASSPPSLLGGPYCFTHLTGPILSETCNAFWFLVNAPVATAKILLDLDADQETPQHIKNVNDIGLNFYVVFYASSFYFMDWHFRASRTFLNTAKPRYWKVYKVVQRFLYCSRLVFLFLLKFMTLSVTFLKIFSCIYILVKKKNGRE